MKLKNKNNLRGGEKRSLKSRTISLILALAIVMTGINWPALPVQAKDYTVTSLKVGDSTIVSTDPPNKTQGSASINKITYTTAGVADVEHYSISKQAVQVKITGKQAGTTRAEIIIKEKQGSYLTAVHNINISVYAVVSLNANGGSCSATSLNTDTSGKVNLPTPTKSGYDFVSWSGSDGKTYSAGSATIKTNVTLTANWKSNHTHAWSYATDPTNANIINAVCTGTGTCQYKSDGASSPLTYTLSAGGSTYKADRAYDTAQVTAVNNITSVTGATPTAVTYYTSYTDASENTKTSAANSGAGTEGGAPKNAGTYYAVASIGDGVAKAEFKIEKANRDCDLSMGQFDYGKFEDSNEPTLSYTNQLSDTVDGVSKTADDIVTFSYKKADASDDSYTAWEKGKTGQGMSAGNYILKAEISETDNYKGKIVTKAFTVSPVNMNTHVVLPSNVVVPYNGESQNIGPVSVRDIDGAEIYYTDKENPTDDDYTKDLSTVAKKDAGQYVISYKVVDTDGNYNNFYGSAKLTIKPIEIDADVTVASTKTYDGKEDAQVTAVDITDDSKDKIVEGETIIISLQAKYDSKDVGTDKTVTVNTSSPTITYENGKATDNYKVKFKSKDQDDGSYVDTDITTRADITAKTVELDWSENANDGAFTYTGKAQELTAKVINLIDGDAANLSYKTDADKKICNKATNVGTYTALVDAIDNTNYVLPKESECKKTWSIAYLEITDDSLPTGDLDWRNAVTIGKDGYEVELANDSSWASDSLVYNTEGSYDISYCVKQTSTGYITDKRTVQFKIDTTAPTGAITIEKEGKLKQTFKAFIKVITFGYFYKEEVQVTIDASDEIDGNVCSGVSTVEYQLVDKGHSYDADENWTAYKKPFSIEANSKKVVYARICDKAGNQTIFNSDGLVVYKDAAPTDSVTFTKLSDKDLVTSLDTNENTIAAITIKNNESSDAAAIVDATNYEIGASGEAAGMIVLKKDFLQGLEAGKYTLTISYNPYGEEYKTDSFGEAAEASTINLIIEKAKGSLTITSKDSKTYDGQALSVPTFETTNTRGRDDANVTIQYKDKLDSSSAYTNEAPKACGSYLVKVTIKADDNYLEASNEAEVTIDHNWSDWKTVLEATADKEGYKARSCAGCNITQYCKIPKIGDTDGSGTGGDGTDSDIRGTVESAVEITDDAIFDEALLNNKVADLLKSDIFTEEEYAAVKNGAAAKIWVKISDTEGLEDTDKESIEAKAEELLGKNPAQLYYFDADLYCSVTQDDVTTTTSLSSLNTNISISIKLPASMVETDPTIVRHYELLRLHDGQIDVLDADYDAESGLLTFETDRFSTYALTYADTQLVTGVTLSPASKTLTAKGQTVKLSATLAPENADNKNVTWSSDKTSVATVDKNGRVIAVANGKAVITVTTEDGAKTATATITVDIPVNQDKSKTTSGGSAALSENTTDESLDKASTASDTNGESKKANKGNSNKKGNGSDASDASGSTDDAENDQLKGNETASDQSDKEETVEIVKTEVKEKSQVSETIQKQTEAAFNELKKLDSKIQEGPIVLPKISDEKSDGARVAFQVELPSDLQKDGRLYYLMRVDSSGNIAILEASVSEDGILTVEGNLDTDASYQIIYEDIADEDIPLSGFIGEAGQVLDADGNVLTVAASAQNTIVNPVSVVVLVIILAFILFIILFWKRRKEDEKN